MLGIFAISNSRRSLPNIWDLIGLVLIAAVFIAVANGSHEMAAPLARLQDQNFDLGYANLPYLALRTTMRMFIALGLSLVFTFAYATIAAKSKRAELVLVPILDVLQSVPILGFLSFTVTFFLGLFPNSVLGAECAAIFAIFTSQAWNMAFSFYQALKTVPKDLDEAAQSFHLSPWQKFWRLETPFAMPGLIWNMMMSMSGGWFFIVASEAIAVGDTTIKLPGIGSYIAVAIEQKNSSAIVAASITMLLVILIYDQILFRPVVAWGSKFRVELSAGQKDDESWVLDIFKRSLWLKVLFAPFASFIHAIAGAPLRLPEFGSPHSAIKKTTARLVDVCFFAGLAGLFLWSAYRVYDFASTSLSIADLREVIIDTIYTFLRVMILILIASVFWVPISVWVGLRPRIAEKIQPMAQFLAAYPANVLFPAVVIVILKFSLTPDLWLSVLVIFGTQWYIVFNVIAGASAFPNDLREAAANFHVTGWAWWKHVMLPGIFPYYFTGALTASGGSWNAAIVAEYVKWGDDKVVAHGIGSYIAQATEAGDYPRIVLGVAVMSLFVILLNRLFWRPLLGYAEKRLRLS